MVTSLTGGFDVTAG